MTPPTVIWHSSAPWSPSGYGGQTRLMARSLRGAGFDVLLSAGDELASSAIRWEGFTVLPSPPLASGSLAQWARDRLDPSRGDLVITLIDLHRLFHEPLGDLPVVSWAPVHGEAPEPGALDHLRSTGTTPVALTEAGRKAFETAGVPDVAQIPLGIDLQIFRPLVDGNRRDSRTVARAALGIDESEFVVGIVATNKLDDNRKSLPEIAQALARFSRDRDDLTVFLHTDVTGDLTGGPDLRSLFAAAGLTAKSRLAWTSPADYRRGLGDDSMAVMYNAFDVLCAPSAAEGFCLPLLEAQACGVPVIASDFTSQAEMVGVGWRVPGQRRWSDAYLTSWFTPSIDGIVAALEAAAARPDVWRDAVAFAQDFDHGRLFDGRWLPLIESMR